MKKLVTVRSAKNPTVEGLRDFIKDEVQKKGIVAFVIYSDEQAGMLAEAFNELEKQFKWRHTIAISQEILILMMYTRELYEDKETFEYGRKLVIDAALSRHGRDELAA